ncbi:2-polyprenyl-6-methoxyphenol hydroxylase-like FAD-dependent oxidoreductase [Herbihabitans rhizosphaerae]|uniref:2-polyprenyl-6-methoxyphenol hydroxylase-like FAD-dependent oxidoreductase n=1 Tax=Herbihabitans rhizosphaerae TaxID=1872711 RepID=A0A4Q7KM45_9PSEU|nr:FAD-dependent monooxygenase [Herbihabitans rhizosphaerae]RZS37739.1 2-polyprenyl-6-methoxyphenol hydroxylase-like FAD-dependent oxidoreductase [Herbihabitans rhizosphaerae]
MTSRTALISGASIAGPALAYWLSRHGWRVTVVERAPALRPGGQAVDFKGETHRTVLERMGILDEVIRRQTGKTDMLIVDEHDRTLATIPGELTGGDVEILRGDLAEVLYEHTADSVEYVFGDRIAALADTGDSVDVTFEHGAPRRFDIVIGADGIHSAVRRLAFGEESEFVRFLGHYYAVIGGNDRVVRSDRATGYMYNEPGRMASIDGPKAASMFVFASDERGLDRADVETQKKALAEAFSGVGWRVPEYLDSISSAPDFYLDSMGRVEMDHYTKGRVALIGDAAYGNTLGGFGSGLAIVGAYVLAGELAESDGDVGKAFARYEEQMIPYAKIARKANAGPYLAPPSQRRIRMRNWMFRHSLPLRLIMRITDKFATDIELREYAVRNPVES